MRTAPDGRRATPARILRFWFSRRVRPRWYRATPALDAEIRTRFETTFRAACAGELDPWRARADGALALVLVLDQFPLNMYRGRPESFATEAAARQVAAHALARGFDRDLDDDGRAFLYLPFMHSESLADQDRAVALYEAAGLDEALRFARHHREIVRRFGRFPHRNAVLGRASTDEERAWLASDDAFLG